jgi:hypothetical protein
VQEATKRAEELETKTSVVSRSLLQTFREVYAVLPPAPPVQREIVKGMTIFVSPFSNLQVQEPEETTVSKVVASLPRERFFLETRKHDGGKYSPRYKAYCTKEAYMEEQERNKLLNSIKISSLSLSQLRTISTWVEEKK